jgi:feruloyl-CoA synthase
VSVGPLRSRILAACAGLAQDVVIAGPDREYVTALVFPNLYVCRDLAGPDGADLSVRALLAHPAVRDRFQEAFARLAAESAGSTTFVARAVLLEDPPSADAREVTDKGSLNQKTVLRNRAAIVESLYAEAPAFDVIVAARL